MRYRSRITVLFAAYVSVAVVQPAAAQKEPFEIIRGTDSRSRGAALNSREAPFEIIRGTGKKVSVAQPAPTANGNRQPRRLTPQELQSRADRYERLGEIESQLVDASYDSFSRGLMSLYDHLDQLNLVLEAEFSRTQDKEAQIALMSRHRDRLQRVARDLNRFNQPSARGWFADLLLAQAMVAQADMDLASLQGNEIAAATAANTARTLAQRHMQQREFDASMGLATLSLVVQAALLTPEGAAQGQEILQDAVATVRRWNRQGALIGRKDRVAETELELTRFEFFAELDKEDGNVAEALERAEAASTRLLNASMEYYGTETAPLFQVARAWNMRRQLYDLAASADEDLFTQERQDLNKRDLARIVTHAAETTDRRGRIAADVAYISLLDELSKPIDAAPATNGTQQETAPAAQTR